MTRQQDLADMERRILTAVDQLVYARQSEWTSWGGLVIDRLQLRNLICLAVLDEIQRTFPFEKVAVEEAQP